MSMAVKKAIGEFDNEEYTNHQLKLVMDTLHGRRIKRLFEDSCFVKNEAGDELCRCDTRVLPVIERVLCEIVVPSTLRKRYGSE